MSLLPFLGVAARRRTSNHIAAIRLTHFPYRGTVFPVKIAQSRVTAQGQVSVPAEVRRRLGVAPGSFLEWDAEGDCIIVRRAHRYTSDEIHRALFPEGPPKPHTLAELTEGIRDHMKRRYARR